MDIDDLKLAWQTLDRRLERQNALAFVQFKDRRVHTMRARLRPLDWGQILQNAVGALVVVAGVAVWARQWPVVHLRIAGLLMHLYGGLLIVAASHTLWLLSRIDYAAPVVAIQRQLGELRQWYVRSGMAIGYAWWLLWMPAMMVLAALVTGADLYARAPRVFALGTAIGLAGLALMAALHQAARRPRWAWIAPLNDHAMTGASLRRVQAVLDEIRQFEDDGGDGPPVPAA